MCLSLFLFHNIYREIFYKIDKKMSIWVLIKIKFRDLWNEIIIIRDNYLKVFTLLNYRECDERRFCNWRIKSRQIIERAYHSSLLTKIH